MFGCICFDNKTAGGNWLVQTARDGKIEALAGTFRDTYWFILVVGLAWTLGRAAANISPGARDANTKQLKALSLGQMGSIEVTMVSTQPEEVWTSAAIRMLTEDDIRRSGAKTVPDLLRLAPAGRAGGELAGTEGQLFASPHGAAFIPGFGQASYAAGDEGAMPHREASVQPLVVLPHGWEIVADYRFVSALPAERVKADQTADGRVEWSFSKHFAVAGNGRNLLQPSHAEFGGDNSNRVGIRRSLYAELEWSK